MSQRITVPSRLAEARARPSGEGARDWIPAACPRRLLASFRPVDTSQSVTFCSSPAEARIRPPDKKARDQMSCGAGERSRARKSLPVKASRNRIVPGCAIATTGAAGEKATDDEVL